jgi:5-methylcytosine-specific restriction endonuclease McrA
MPNRDSSLWKEAYAAYSKQQSKYVSYGKKQKHLKKKGYKPNLVRVDWKATWLKTTREFYAWKKTEDYAKWRKRQFGRQAGLCYYCDKSLVGVKTDIEHVIPRSKGGTNKKNNLVLACWRCNKQKGSNELARPEKKALKQKHNSKRQIRNDELAILAEIRSHLKED